jgi:UDP-hydrolysing UDP-N-acetyl-D-glucosamine 2-epimerase
VNKRKLCVVTGTRAEYGLLYGLMKEINQDSSFELQLVVTGMHLSPEYGLTYQEIQEHGFQITAKVEMLMSSDTPVGTAKSIGLGVIGFAEVFERLRPDLLIIFGDRFEMLAAAQAAMVANIPIAHIAGGDITEGAFDEAIRHSLTKMSHLHFVTNPQSGQRVKQLGENPKNIYMVGSPGIDNIKRLKLIPRSQLEKELNFTFLAKNLLVTFHPVTLDSLSSTGQFMELLKALENFIEHTGIIFTKPNSDPTGRELTKLLDDYVKNHANCKLYTSLGQLRYLSTMAQVDAVVGNSSSGLYEAPSLKKPTVNIGDRQKGRLNASSVIHCQPVAQAIEAAILQAFEMDCFNVVNPYGDGESSRQIFNILKGITNYHDLLKKHFFEI